MPDPTATVITATFCTALGVFIITAAVRAMFFRKREGEGFQEIEPSAGNFFDASHPMNMEAGHSVPSAENQEIYGAPFYQDQPPALPPPLPGRGIPTWFYTRGDLFGLGFVFLVFFALVVSSVRASAQKEVVLDPGTLIASIGFQFICAGIVTAFVVFRVSPIVWLGLKWRQWRWVFLIAPSAVLGMWVFFFLLQAVGFMKWVETFGVEAVQDTVKLLQQSTDPAVLALMTIAAVIAAPICEEIVFRGYLYPAAKRFAGPWAACICSALVFAAAHGSMAALLPLFVFGCVLVFIYEKTGSIWAPMAVHFCFNGATVLVQMATRYLHLPMDGP